MISHDILLDDGSGGKASHRLIRDVFVAAFDNPMLNALDDAAALCISGVDLAMSTDAYTVDPLEFPGGDIGSLAVHGTVNDVAMLGARPLFLSAAFIIEEGLSRELLQRIVTSMARAARDAGVTIVTGDTKVVPKGMADKLYITTTGLGKRLVAPGPAGHRAAFGDAILLSGSLGDHGLTVLSQRQGLALASSVQSDSCALNHMTEALVTELQAVHVLRDPTRGGLATTLNEIAHQSQVACLIEEKMLPVSPEVKAGCAVLGLDPLYLANEGKLVCILPQACAQDALAIMRRFPAGAHAVRIGTVLAPDQEIPAGKVLLQTLLKGKRLLGMLEGEQLPRIC